MWKGLRREVIGPVNNGASASLHSVSIWESGCAQRAPCRGDKCGSDEASWRQGAGRRPETRREANSESKSTPGGQMERGLLLWKGDPDGASPSRRAGAGWRDADGFEAQRVTFHPRGLWGINGETRAHCCHLMFPTDTEHIFDSHIKTTFNEEFIDLYSTSEILTVKKTLIWRHCELFKVL